MEVLEKLIAIVTGFPLHLPPLPHSLHLTQRSDEEKDQWRNSIESNSIPSEPVTVKEGGKKSQKNKNKHKTPPPPPSEVEAPPSSPRSASLNSLHSNGQEMGKISFSQWLMLCKALAYYQETRRQPSEKLFKNLHSSTVKLSLADFQLGKVQKDWALGKLWLDFKVHVSGWQVYGDDYSNQHTKYRIASHCALHQALPFLIPAKAEEINASTAPDRKRREEEEGVSLTALTTIVERRYSEFEAFDQILVKCFRGYIIPPLPVKNYTTSNTSEFLLKQRSIEFQMFLHHLTRHPQLSKSYEVMSFLTSSTNGFKAFVDVYNHRFRHHQFDNSIQSDVTTSTASSSSATSSSSSSSQSNGMTKLLQDSTSLLTNGANSLLSSAKSLDFVSSLWGHVSKTVSSIAAPIIGSNSNPLIPSHHVAYQHLLHNTPEDALLFTKTSQQLEHVTAIARAYDKLQHAEEGRMQELSKLAGAFKATSELESQPDLVRILQISHDKMTQVARIEQETMTRLMSDVAIPLNYLGRFIESFRVSLQQRHLVQDQLIQAHKEENERKKKVEVLLSQSRSITSSSTNVASSSSVTSSPNTTAWKQSTIRSGYPDESLTHSFDEMKLKEEEVNVAKLSLVEAENIVEQRKLEEADITQVLRGESAHISLVQRRNVLDCLIHLTKEKIQETQQSTEFWLAMKESLEK